MRVNNNAISPGQLLDVMPPLNFTSTNKLGFVLFCFMAVWYVLIIREISGEFFSFLPFKGSVLFHQVSLKNYVVRIRGLQYVQKFCVMSYLNKLEGVHLTLSSHIFSVQVKSGACYITGEWGRVQNKI